METITVHNSSRRSWLVVALGGLLMMAAIDLLVWNQVVAGLAERIYQGEEVLEARERVWAGIMAATGIMLAVWGVTSGIRWRPALTVGPDGISIALRGPFRPLDSLPWEEIDQVFPQPVSDGGSLLPSLTIVLRTPDPRRHLPIDPWGARWAEGRILRVLASDWSLRAEAVSAVSNHYLELVAQSAPPADHE